MQDWGGITHETDVPQRHAPGAAPRRVLYDPADYAFLLGHLIDEPTLSLAVSEADTDGITPHEILIARGWITQHDYIRALDRALAEAAARQTWPSADRHPKSRLIDARRATPSAVALEYFDALWRSKTPLLLGTDALDWSEGERDKLARVQAAAHGLRHHHPELSAASRIASWLLVVAPVAFGLSVGGLAIAPAETLAALAAIVTLPFLFVVGLRMIALLMLLTGLGQSKGDTSGPPIPDAELPVYSIMVPMFREAEVLPGLVAALLELDYPSAKLDIMLVLESVDAETQQAARDLDLPANIRIIVVPDLAPRTKPKALNYALGSARGDYVVVYDAEDEPEPDQLRRAVTMFRTGPANLTCVQASLNIDNRDTSWLTRQFTLEYTALFDALLPALARLGLPVPLGGTSNHFPLAKLRELGGWDAHNVTEDADLGLRIARGGGTVAVLASTTWEEAPTTLPIWVRQRTRWLKGFMQTWLVHMRHPFKLAADLGPIGFLGFHAFIGGIILSALIHPIFAALLIASAVTGDLLLVPQSDAGVALLSLAAFNLVGGYVAGIAIAGIAAARRGWLGLLTGLVGMPVYWIMISLTSYRALWQLIVNPYLWEKTPHRARSSARKRQAGNRAAVGPHPNVRPHR